MKDHDLENIYSTFLSSYSTARGKGATPTCMLPADLPVVQFVMEMILHLCCMPVRMVLHLCCMLVRMVLHLCCMPVRMVLHLCCMPVRINTICLFIVLS